MLKQKLEWLEMIVTEISVAFFGVPRSHRIRHCYTYIYTKGPNSFLYFLNIYIHKHKLMNFIRYFPFCDSVKGGFGPVKSDRQRKLFILTWRVSQNGWHECARACSLAHWSSINQTSEGLDICCPVVKSPHNYQWFLLDFVSFWMHIQSLYNNTYTRYKIV